MLSYLETIAKLTHVRDTIREDLADESLDRQAVLESTERDLTLLLGELVTPDAMCRICGAIAVGVTDTKEGVCEVHVFGVLLLGHSVNMSPRSSREPEELTTRSTGY